MLSMCYKRIMRDWVREKLMRRRKKPVTNESESTGKIGHEIPQDQPTPLQPSYPQPLETEDTARIPTRPDHDADVYSDIADTPASSQAEHAPATSSEPEPVPEPGSRQPGRSAGQSGNRGRNRGRNRSDNRSRDARPSAPSGPEQDSSGSDSGEPTLVHETQPDSLAQPPAPLEPAKSPKGYVVLAIGLPGSGKTTWFKRRGVTPLSSDMLRSILFDDITEQRYQGLVFSTLRSLLRARLIAKMPWNYVDATNLSPHERRQWIKMARSFGYEVHAVFFDVPFEICRERNMRRDRMLSEEDMAKMQERLRPPSFKEGFHKITVVRVKNGAATPSEAYNSEQ